MQVKYPLKISTNKRYLVDQEDSPFFLQGEAPWSLIVGVTKEDAEMYLANRSKKRFNAILVNLIEHAFCENPPKNIYGEDPFTTVGDFTTPNEKYFQHADWVISKAAEYNIAVLLCPMFLGYQGQTTGGMMRLLRRVRLNVLSMAGFSGRGNRNSTIFYGRSQRTAIRTSTGWNELT